MPIRRSKRKKNRKRNKDLVKRISRELPTQERLAKGNVILLPSGQMRCIEPTFLDTLVHDPRFYDSEERKEVYESMAYMLDLTERSGLFASPTRCISEMSFINNSCNPDTSAADIWRSIIAKLSSEAKPIIVDLMADPYPRQVCEIEKRLPAMRELTRVVLEFRVF